MKRIKDIFNLESTGMNIFSKIKEESSEVSDYIHTKIRSSKKWNTEYTMYAMIYNSLKERIK